MAAIRETMEPLHEVGAIDKQTMRRFDEVCLAPVEPLSASAEEISSTEKIRADRECRVLCG